VHDLVFASVFGIGMLRLKSGLDIPGNVLDVDRPSLIRKKNAVAKLGLCTLFAFKASLHKAYIQNLASVRTAGFATFVFPN
jgi:hypothetical protein